MKLSREDTQYKEIEKFKDFELTQCIAYEMAKRNREIQKLNEEYNKVRTTKNLDAWIDEFNTTQSDEEFEKVVKRMIETEGIDIKDLQQSMALENEIKKKSFFPPRSNYGKTVKNEKINEHLSRTSQKAQVSRSNIVDTSSLGSEIFTDDGKAKTHLGGVIDYGKLYPAFSRPQPIIPADVSKEIDIHINLKLPAKELMAYVEAVKKNYDKSNGEAYQSATPLNIAADINREIFSIQIKIKQKGSKTNLEMPEKTQQEVYADLFFLYDVYTNMEMKKKSDKFIFFRNGLIDYYAKKVCKYHGIDDIDEVSDSIGAPREQTVREYLKMMQGYIDDFGYKQLLA